MSNSIPIWMKSIEARVHRVHTFARCDLTFYEEHWRFRCITDAAMATSFEHEETYWEFFAPSLVEVMEKANHFADDPKIHIPLTRSRYDQVDNYGYPADHQARLRRQELAVELERAKYEMRPQIERDILERLMHQGRIEIEHNCANDSLVARRGRTIW